MYTPALANMKLAEFRYGKEEMLALFSPELDPPKELLSLGALYVDSCQFPLNLTQVSLKIFFHYFLCSIFQKKIEHIALAVFSS